MVDIEEEQQHRRVGGALIGRDGYLVIWKRLKAFPSKRFQITFTQLDYTKLTRTFTHFRGRSIKA